MNYRLLASAIAALSSAHITTAAAQSVYVAPGGVYIGGGPVYVIPAPSNGNGTYVEPTYGYGYGVQEPTPYLAPTVVAPGAGYVGAALYGLNRNRYGDAYGYGYGNGSGYGDGYGNGYGNGYGYRNGNGYGYGPPPPAFVMTTGVRARGVGVRPGTPANRGRPVNRVGRR